MSLEMTRHEDCQKYRKKIHRIKIFQYGLILNITAHTDLKSSKARRRLYSKLNLDFRFNLVR